MIQSISNLKPGQTYVVQFAGVLPDGTTTPWTNSYTIVVPDSTVHDSPTAPGFSYSTGNIRLSWTPGTLREDFDAFIVEVLTDADASLGIFSVGSNSHFDFTLSVNDSLSPTPLSNPKFKVFARTRNGSLSVPLTAQASYPTMGGTFAAPQGAPIVKGVLWSWLVPGTQGEIVNRYEVDVMTSSGSWAVSDLTSYGDNALWVGSEGTNYYAVVRAYDVFGRTLDTPASGAVTSGTAAGADTTPPNAPTSPAWTAAGTGQDGRSEMTATWVAPSPLPDDMAGYSLRYWAVDTESGGAPTTTSNIFVDDVATSVVLRDLTPNKAYRFEVSAFDKSGNFSAYTRSGGGGTTTPVVAAPTAISGTVTANWSTSDLVITFVDSRTPGSLTYFSHYEVEIVYNGTTKTYRSSVDKRVVISPQEWVSIWGTNVGLSNTNISVYAVNSFGQRSTAVQPSTLTALGSLVAGGTPSIASVSDGKVSFTWTPSTSSGIVKYEVIAVASASGATNPTIANLVQTVGPNQTPTPPISLTVGTSSHLFKVATIVTDIFGRTAQSSAFTSSTPSAPTGTTIYPGIDVMKVTWSGSAYRYNVYAGTTNPPTQLIESVTSAQREVSWLTNGSTSTWYSDVVPVNEFGTVGTKGSDSEVGLTVPAGSLDVTAPSVPTGLAVSNSPGTTLGGLATLQVTWTAPAASDLAEYEIRWTSSGTDINWSSAVMTKIASGGATETYYIRGLIPGTTYRVQVAASDASGNRSAFTASATGTTAVVATIETPTGLLTGDFSLPDLSLTWTDTQTYSSHFWGYEVRISTDSFATFKSWRVNRKTGTGPAGTFVLTNAENKSVFNGTALSTFAVSTIRVYALDIYGNVSSSYLSNTGAGGNSGALTNGAPTSPGTVTFTYGAAGAITANWTAVADADFLRYKIVVTNNSGSVSRTYYVYGKTINSWTIPFTENKAIFGGQTNIKITVSTEDVVGLSTAATQVTAAYPAMANLAAPTGTAFLEGVSYTWTAPTTNSDIVSYYDLDVELNAGTVNWATIDGSKLQGLSYAKSGLVGGSSYKAGVRATDIFGRTLDGTVSGATVATANTAAIGDGLVPSGAPTWTYTSSTDFAGISKINLDITYSQPTDFSHYSIKWGTAPATYTNSAVATEKKFTVYGLSKTTTYYFLVEAWDTEGKKNSGSVETNHSTPAVSALLSPTGNLTTTPPQWIGNNLRITWTDTQSYTTNSFGGYKVVLNNNANGWFTPLKTLDITPEMQLQILGALDSQIAAGDIDVYSVSSLDQTILGATPLTTTVAYNKAAPSAVTNLNLYPAVGQITAKWDAGGIDVVKYKVYARAGAVPGRGAAYLVYEGVGTSATFNTQTSNPGTQWYVEVDAVDAFGTTQTTATSSNATSKVSISGIENPTGTLTGTYNSQNLVLSWTDPQTYNSGLFAGYRVVITANSKTYSWDVAAVVNGTEKGRLVLNQQEQREAFATTVTSYAINSIKVYARDINDLASSTYLTNGGGAVTNVAPANPTALVKTLGTHSVTYSWTEPGDTDVEKGAGSYLVSIHSDSGRTTLVRQVTVRVPNVTITGLDSGTDYWFRVQSVDTVAQSSAGLDDTFTTLLVTKDDIEPSVIADVTSDPVFIHYFGSDSGVSGWANVDGTTGMVWYDNTTSPTVPGVLKFTTNTNSHAEWLGSEPFLYDPAALYRVRIRAKADQKWADTKGMALRAGFMTYAGDRTTKNNQAGANSFSTMPYCVEKFSLSDIVTIDAGGTEWYEFTGYIGSQDPAPVGAGTWDSPLQIKDSSKYWRPTIQSVLTSTDISVLNRLSAADSGFESSAPDPLLGTWVTNAGCTIAQSAAQAYAGTYSMAVTSTAASGNAQAVNASNLNGTPVVGNRQYSAMARSRANSTTRPAWVQINWYNSAGQYLNNSPSSQTTNSNSVWTQHTVTATAHPDAAFASVSVTFTSSAIGQVIYWDDIYLLNGTTAGVISDSPVIEVDSFEVYRLDSQVVVPDGILAANIDTTSLTTENLTVSGTPRFSAGPPVAGSVLTALDDTGSAAWAVPSSAAPVSLDGTPPAGLAAGDLWINQARMQDTPMFVAFDGTSSDKAISSTSYAHVAAAGTYYLTVPTDGVLKIDGHLWVGWSSGSAGSYSQGYIYVNQIAGGATVDTGALSYWDVQISSTTSGLRHYGQSLSRVVRFNNVGAEGSTVELKWYGLYNSGGSSAIMRNEKMYCAFYPNAVYKTVAGA